MIAKAMSRKEDDVREQKITYHRCLPWQCPVERRVDFWPQDTTTAAQRTCMNWDPEIESLCKMVSNITFFLNHPKL